MLRIKERAVGGMWYEELHGRVWREKRQMGK